MPALAIIATSVAIALAPAAQAADAPAADTPPPAEAKLAMRVDVQKFVVDRSGIRAIGYASANVGGKAVGRRVSLKVKSTSHCSILSLDLKDLQLQLLGLHLDASEINLRITGDPKRTLGSLFCKLSKQTNLGNIVKARQAAHSLNLHMRRRPMHVIAIHAKLHAMQALSPAACDVLDITLGPLNLDLLGLIVDLYGPTPTKPVTVNVSADPAGGVLGSTFCKLATPSS